MPRRYGSFYPRRINQRVPSLAMVGDAVDNDIVVAEWSAPTALNSTGILAAQDMTSAGSTSTFAAAFAVQSEAIMGRWGRALRIVASGASTGTVTVTGSDYLGQRMIETATLNGATPVLMLKAFRFIESIAWTATGATNLTVGWRDVFGLPYKFVALVSEVKNKAVAANAGTFVAGLATATAATATNADVRGTYLPVTVIPDGVNNFEVRYIFDNSNGHGNAQFIA